MCKLIALRLFGRAWNGIAATLGVKDTAVGQGVRKNGGKRGLPTETKGDAVAAGYPADTMPVSRCAQGSWGLTTNNLWVLSSTDCVWEAVCMLGSRGLLILLKKGAQAGVGNKTGR